MDEDFLQDELQSYQKDKEKIKKIVGNIGGAHQSKKHMVFNVLFLATVLISFFMGGVLHYIPWTLSLELGILLVSFKIAWMIHEQQKMNHFQFWILNTLEFRINSLQSGSRKLQKEIVKLREENEKLRFSIEKEDE